MDRLSRSIKTKRTHNNADNKTKHIQTGKRNLPLRRKPQFLVHEQPECTGETETEPAGEEGSLYKISTVAHITNYNMAGETYHQAK